MAEYLSGSISFAGIGNGTDFKAMIAELRKIEELPKKRLEVWQNDWKLRYDAFDELSKTVDKLATSFAKISTPQSLLKKTSTSSDEKVATAESDSKVPDGVHSIEVKQLATNAVLTSNQQFDSKDVKITLANDSKIFAYEYKGETYKIELGGGVTLENFVERINNDPKNPGVSASLVKNGDGYVFQLQGKDTGDKADVRISPFTNMSMFVSNGSVSGSLGPDKEADKTGKYTVLNAATSGVDRKFTYTHDNVAYTITVPPGATAEDLAAAVNANTKTTGVSATFIKDGDGNTRLSFDSASGKAVGIKNPAPPDHPVTAPGLWEANVISNPTAAGWSKRESQDAIFSLNGMEREFKSDTNVLDEAIEGLKITIKDVGKTKFTIATSTEDLKGKVEEFVTGFNELLKNVQELTKIKGSNNSLTTDTSGSKYDPDAERKKAESLYNSQKGSLLTGNYGVQLLVSRFKSAATDPGIGFTYRKEDGSGDLFHSLSSIGIIMDSNEGSSTFGQLKYITQEEADASKLDPTKSYPLTSLDDAIKKDPKAVVNLLAGKGGVTDSKNFSYNSHNDGITKPGTYKVEYTIGPDGSLPEFIMVNGAKATQDSPGSDSYTVGAGNAASGMNLTINNRDPGKVSSSVRLQQGKIAEITQLFKDELRTDPITADSPSDVKRGSLVILKDNYKGIMDGIQVKIDKETERLVRWDRTQRAKYARLDALLGRYDNMMAANSSALAKAE